MSVDVFGLEETETLGNRLANLLRHFMWGVFRISVPTIRQIFSYYTIPYVHEKY